MNNSDAPAYTDNWDAKLPGLTKREYFAAMAMQGLLADTTLPVNPVAEYAVIQADALLRELEK